MPLKSWEELRKVRRIFGEERCGTYLLFQVRVLNGQLEGFNICSYLVGRYEGLMPDSCLEIYSIRGGLTGSSVEG